MKGTSFSHTLAMDWMPPMMTMAVRMPPTIPMTMGGMRKGTLFSMTSAMALIWVPQPMPKEAMVASRAKATPSHFRFSPRSRAYMAPPCILPSLVRTRYLTAMRDSAYLVAMPNTPAIQHQNTAPGPPRKMAVPTPMMLPVPMVEARAVVRAWNWLTSPGESGSLVTDSRMPVNSLRWMKPVRTVINRWVPSSRTIMGIPQIKSSSQLMKVTIASMLSPLL